MARRPADVPDGGRVRVSPLVAWRAVRPEAWPPPVPGPVAVGSLALPGPLLGVACLMCAIGPGSATWLRRLDHSDWYATMRPRPADLAGRDPQSGLSADAAVALFPEAPFATVAVMDGAIVEEVAGLVHALKREAGETRRLRVVVTVGATMAGDIVPAMQQEDVLTIRGDAGMAPDHLHHFPQRAAFRPATGRLVCVDLADCLLCWMSGRVADLRLIPFNARAAGPDLMRIAHKPRPSAAMLIAHFPPAGPDSTLAALDRLAHACRLAAFGVDGDARLIFTTGERPDGMTGTADYLLVHDGM